MLSDAQIIEKYGKPGDLSNITKIVLPYPMRIAWDTDVSVKSMQCHHLVAGDFYGVFNDLLHHYGLAELQRLSIDLFGGCLNVRPMRGTGPGTRLPARWSRHAWGVAIDLDPARNALKWTKARARFAKPEYKPMIDIFYKHGFIGLGPESDRDWMHFEINK